MQTVQNSPSFLFRPRVLRGLLFGALPSLVLCACASTGVTFRSGVGDTFLEHPPYYAGADLRSTAETIRTGHLPIAYQRGAAHAPIFDPSVTGAMAELLERMNAFLDSLAVTVRLVEGGRVSAVTRAATRFPPDVQFGCTPAADDDCAERGDSALGRRGQTMRLAVGRPSPEWTAWMQQVMDDVGVERALLITLEVGQYLIRQRGLRGTKEVELGTSHVERLPWLTSLETPVSVLQLSGALLGRDGKAIRIGAEGLIARRTSLPLSGIGAQTLITDEDVQRLLVARREDLPGAPLVWEVGLRTLAAQLVGRAREPDS